MMSLWNTLNVIISSLVNQFVSIRLSRCDLQFRVSIEYHTCLTSSRAASGRIPPSGYTCFEKKKKAIGAEHDLQNVKWGMISVWRLNLGWEGTVGKRLLSPWMEKVVDVHSISARLPCTGTWTWHASWSFKEAAVGGIHSLSLFRVIEDTHITMTWSLRICSPTQVSYLLWQIRPRVVWVLGGWCHQSMT